MASTNDGFSYSSDSDDDAPGEVSSSAVRSTKLSEVRSNRQRDREVNEKEREKRRNRNDMFTSQKRQKIESFGGRALSEDILEAVSSKKSKLDQESEDEFSDANDNDNEADKSDNDSKEGSDDDSDDEGSYDSSDDFIALAPSTKKDALNVVTVENPKKNTSSLEKALAFKNQRLFSGPHAPNRCSADKRKALVEKKKMLRMK